MSIIPALKVYSNNDNDLLIGTESHLDSSTLMFPNHFNTYRKDRNSHGGGTFISVKDTVPSSLIVISTPIEIVWVYLYR